jgi:hypothetical protein
MPKQKTQRNEEMKRLRMEDGWHLIDIANKYDISRERVRQIIGNTGKKFRTQWTEAKSVDYNLENIKDITSLPGTQIVWKRLWGKFRHQAKGGNIKTGQEYENKASEMLNSLGIPNKLMPTHHSFDILLDNGLRIDVKHSIFDASSMKTQKYISPTFPISNMKNGKECDFFFVFIPDAVFIIPSSEVRVDRIRIPYPQKGQKPSKWVQYKDRYDLLSNRTLT